MKKILLFTFTAMLIFNMNVKGQITLQYSLDSVTTGNQFYCTDIGNNDYKYVFLDTAINGFKLYNMNMSLYMTVHIPAPGDSIKNGFTVAYITKSLFDCDSNNIEYVFENQYNLNHPFRIFRTDGTLLLQVDSANGPYDFGAYGASIDIRPIQNTSDGTKMFLQKRNNQYWSGIKIYSLCGSLPVNMYDFSEHNKSFVKIFPNPSSMELNFEIISPNNYEEFKLVILDSNSKEQKKEDIHLLYNKYTLDVSSYSSGLYSYSLISKNKTYQSGKFILTK